MNERLRKKKHKGEFTQWGCQIVIKRNRKDEFNDFFYTFVEQAVEANDCYCGGGGKEDKLEVVVELGCSSDNPKQRLDNITAWLQARSDVESWGTGKIFDVWTGDWDDINGESKRN